MLRAAAVSYAKGLGLLSIALWVLLSGAAGLTIYQAYSAEMLTPDLLEKTLLRMGWIAAASGLVACVLGFKIVNIAPWVFLAWFATFGVWFPALNIAIKPHLGDAIQKYLSFAKGMTASIEIALTILIAGLTSSLLLLIATRRQKSFQQMALLTLLVSVATLIPAYSMEILAISAFVWLSGAIACVLMWGVSSAARMGLSCMNCGLSMRGISGEHCPGCGWSSKRHQSPSFKKLSKLQAEVKSAKKQAA